MDKNQIIALDTFLNKYPENKTFAEIIEELYGDSTKRNEYDYEKAEIYQDFGFPYASLANLIEDLYSRLS